MEVEISRNLGLVYSVTFLPLGIAFNMVSIYIFCQKKLNKNTQNGRLNAFLCLFNIFALSNSFLFTQFLPYFNIYLIDQSHFACTFLNVWRRFALQSPSFQQVLITVLFYLNVRFPNKLKFLKKKFFLMEAIIFMSLAIFLINIEYFWFEYRKANDSSLINYDELNLSANSTSFSYMICQADLTLSLISDVINILMRSFIPFIILLIFNILILKVVKSSSARIVNQNVDQRRSRNEMRFGKVIISVNFLLLLLYTPWTISFILNYSFTKSGLKASNIDKNANSLVGLTLSYNISLCITYLFNSSPFFINIIFNRLFKEECIKMVKCLSRKENQISSMSTNNTTVTKIKSTNKH